MIWQICDMEGVVCFNESIHDGGPLVSAATPWTKLQGIEKWGHFSY